MSIVFAGLHEGRGDFPLHHHEVWELVYVRDGAVTTIQSGEPIHLTPGMVLVNPPRVLHCDVYLRPYELIYLFVDGSAVEDFGRVMYDDAEQELGRAFDAIWREWNAQLPDQEEMLRTLATQLEILLRRRSAKGPSGERDYLLIEAERLLRHSVGNPLTLDEVAERIGVSRSWLYPAFRQSFGSSPHDYVSRLRLEKALALLRHSSHKMAFVADECGYASGSHLTHHIRRATGRSPGEIRESARQTLPTDPHRTPVVTAALTTENH